MNHWLRQCTGESIIQGYPPRNPKPGHAARVYGYGGNHAREFKVEDQLVLPGREPHTNLSIVSPGYFQTMGVPLLQGRDFSAADKADAPGVVIISSYLAQMAVKSSSL